MSELKETIYKEIAVSQGIPVSTVKKMVETYYNIIVERIKDDNDTRDIYLERLGKLKFNHKFYNENTKDESI